MSTPTPRAYRDAMALYASGVSVVAADDGTEAYGMTVSSFTSVSLDPMLLLVCLGAESTLLPIAERAGRFALHVLQQDQADLAMLFAGKDHDARQLALRRYAFEPPSLARPGAALARFDCMLHDRHAAGDHVILIGRPVKIDTEAEARPLVWWRGKLGPAPAAE